MAAGSARGAGTCDVGGCGGWVEAEELVYVCTEHNDYACRECVPRAARLTVDVLLDECAMVERELGQFSQDLGLGVSELEEAVVDGAVGGDVAVGDVAGRERDEGLEVLARSGLAAASWVAGRRRATRKVTGWQGGRKGSGGLVDEERREVEEVEEGDTSWDDLAPQSPNHAKEVVVRDDVRDVDHAPRGPAASSRLAYAARQEFCEPETLREAASQRQASVEGEVTGVRGRRMDVLAPQAPDHVAVLGVDNSGVTLMLERPGTLQEEADQRQARVGAASFRTRHCDSGVGRSREGAGRKYVDESEPQLSSCLVMTATGEQRSLRDTEELQQQQHSERTKRKAGENTMMERLDGDEGIE